VPEQPEQVLHQVPGECVVIGVISHELWPTQKGDTVKLVALAHLSKHNKQNHFEVGPRVDI
jgi:hypothetical protein